MLQYKYLLFDLDNTLLDFNRAEETAFYAAFSASGLIATQKLYARYHKINAGLWQKLEKKEISRDALFDLRFELLLSEIGVDSRDLIYAVSRTFFTLLSQQRFLIDGASDVCAALTKEYALYIITNGYEKTQTSRFAGCGLSPYFKEIFISEQIGAEKPSPRFFSAVMTRIGDPNPSYYLVIGDSLTSDIDGAKSAGMDAVWIDNTAQGNTHGRDISYIINTIRQLPLLLSP